MVRAALAQGVGLPMALLAEAPRCCCSSSAIPRDSGHPGKRRLSTGKTMTSGGCMGGERCAGARRTERAASHPVRRLPDADAGAAPGHQVHRRRLNRQLED